MDYEKALIILQCLLIDLGLQEKNEGQILAEKALKYAIKALQKQVKSEIHAHDGMFVVCPSCKAKVLPSEHCPKCGQALMDTGNKYIAE